MRTTIIKAASQRAIVQRCHGCAAWQLAGSCYCKVCGWRASSSLFMTCPDSPPHGERITYEFDACPPDIKAFNAEVELEKNDAAHIEGQRRAILTAIGEAPSEEVP